MLFNAASQVLSELWRCEWRCGWSRSSFTNCHKWILEVARGLCRGCCCCCDEGFAGEARAGSGLPLSSSRSGYREKRRNGYVTMPKNFRRNKVGGGGLPFRAAACLANSDAYHRKKLDQTMG